GRLASTGLVLAGAVAGIEGNAEPELGELIAWGLEEAAHPGLVRVRPYTSQPMSTIMPSRTASSWRCHGMTRSRNLHPSAWYLTAQLRPLARGRRRASSVPPRASAPPARSSSARGGNP